MKAIGASTTQILWAFLTEAILLALIGGAIGIAGGLGLTTLARVLYPDVPFRAPAWALGLAIGVAGIVGLTFGILPAAQAARMEPLDALRRRV
jgi:putative ABC transport system permease protein